MDWNTFYQENHEVIIGGSFTIIGVVIGWALNLIQSHFQNEKEQQVHLRTKREEAYTAMLKSFQSLRNHYLMTKEFDIPDELFADFEETLNFLRMYASNDILGKYNIFMDEFEKDYRNKNNNSEHRYCNLCLGFE